MMLLKRQPAPVHRRLLALATSGLELRNRLHAADKPNEVSAVGVDVAAWLKAATEAGPELFRDGMHLLQLRQEFERRDRTEMLGSLPALVANAKRLEASRTYDIRQLEDAAHTFRDRALAQFDQLLLVLRQQVADVERLLPTHGTQPTIFFSWQSDSPNNTNRSLIERALELAIKEVSADLSVDVSPRLDDAGIDVVGAEDIAATILRKIDEAAIFVGDVSIVGHATPTRPTPNPNVLVETGYAIKALGPGRVVLMFNTASGRLEDLPFDLRPRQTLTYRANPSAPGELDEERVAERRQLAKELVGVIRLLLEKAPPPQRLPDVRVSVSRGNLYTEGVPTPQLCVAVKAQNLSSETVHLAAVSFHAEGGEQFVITKDVNGLPFLPQELKAGASVTVAYPIDVILEGSESERFTYVEFSDQIDRGYRSPEGELERAVRGPAPGSVGTR